jgi:pimeloyl-ACP methyl ester carboxylesterase
MTSPGHVIKTAFCAAGVMMFSGCLTPEPDRAERLNHGYVVYFDGAGGGSVVTNWGRGVKKGLLAAGYEGAGEEFVWETGAGVLADQRASVAYKRKKAAEAAEHIKQYAKVHPGQPITLMGLSAGTAIAIYALEALPESVSVKTVVLLSGSLSSGYDLTQALEHVQGKVYVTTSPHDKILSDVVPITGSADRENVGNDVIGVHGCHLPPNPSHKARQLYSKVEIIKWDPSFRQYGDAGGHTGTTTPRFVQHVIAPLIMR